MREIEAGEITETIARLCRQANYELGDDVLAGLELAEQTEESPLGRAVLRELLENAQIAREGVFPLCQDCGTAVVFLEVGQDVHIVGGELHEAVDEGVRQGYAQGYLRKSMVRQPFTTRVNTGDNTPAVLHTEIVPGDRLGIVVMSKGGGAENMSRLAMLKPAQGREGGDKCRRRGRGYALSAFDYRTGNRRYGGNGNAPGEEIAAAPGGTAESGPGNSCT
jgi:fumarate hydratase subunit alpha